jgi:hypothetical protein
MKRFLILLLCLFLLTGCASDPQTPSSPETEPSISQEQPGVPLLDQGKAAGESGNLLYIPNPHVESMACPEIRLFGNGLLLYEHTMNGMLQLKRISLEDGTLLAEASYPMDASASVQVGNGLIGLCDSSNRQVLILNESLEQETTYSVPLEGEYWYLNQELETVYAFLDEGLLSYDLEAGQAHWLLDDAAFVQPFRMGSGYVLFSYTDRNDQKTCNRCLNLSTASMETVPVEGFISSGIRRGEQWLLRRDIASGTYILVDQENAVTFTCPEGLVELLSGKRHLLITDGSYRELSLYDLEGNFLSRCALPETEHASVGTDLVWSGYWQGYFFRDTYENTAHLMFWDIDTAQEGENLPVTSLDAVQAPESVVEKELYQQAADLSRRFGVDIRIAEQCALDYSHYQADVLLDPYQIRYALNVLDLAFNSYPEGFLNQLPFDTMEQIRIELVDNLRGKEGMDTHPIDIGGFAQENFDHYLIVFNSLSLDTQTVYHELSHVIDKHLEWDASLRPQALFSEEAWLALQPEGFRYAGSYTDMPDSIRAYEDSGYFINSYAMTFPTEDRATLMSVIMSDKTVPEENPGMAEKMRYYAACIRDCFDTEGWPESTLWEYTK